MTFRTFTCRFLTCVSDSFVVYECESRDAQKLKRTGLKIVHIIGKGTRPL